MTESDNGEKEYYDKLVELAKPLNRWFSIDKIKPWAIYIYNQTDLEDEWNIFDIESDIIRFYNELEFNECDIPIGAFPVIYKIKEHLKYGQTKGFWEYEN